MRNFRNYEVWKKSHRFTLLVYKITKDFPKEEIYGLTSQIRRASLSIPNNIAEGAARNSEKEFAYFLNVAQGSASEVEYLIEFSRDIKYLNKKGFEKLNEEIIEIRKMLNSLYNKIQSGS